MMLRLIPASQALKKKAKAFLKSAVRLPFPAGDAGWPFAVGQKGLTTHKQHHRFPDEEAGDLEEGTGDRCHLLPTAKRP